MPVRLFSFGCIMRSIKLVFLVKHMALFFNCFLLFQNSLWGIASLSLVCTAIVSFSEKQTLCSLKVWKRMCFTFCFVLVFVNLFFKKKVISQVLSVSQQLR